MLPYRKGPMIAPRLLAVTLLVAALLPTPVAAAATAQPGTSTPSAPQPVLNSEGPNLIQNPSFETPALQGETADVEFTDPNAFVPGWTLSGTASLVRCTTPDADVCKNAGAPWPAQDGVQSVDVARSNKTGTLTQVVPTPLGHTFTLSFYYIPGPRLIDSKSDAKINVYWAGSKLPLTLEDRQSGERAWKYTGKVALPAPITDDTELSFKGLAGKNFGFAIDNVSVVDDAPVTPDPDQVNAPELYRAAPPYTPPTATTGGSFDVSKLQVLGLSPNDPGTYELSFYAAASCTAMDTAGTKVATWTLTTAASDTTPIFVTPALDAAIPSATPFVAARITGPASSPGVAGKVSGLSNCVVYGPENDAWPRALRIPLMTGTVSLGNWIDEPGIGRWFKVKVAPGGSVTVNLSNLPADYDVYLFKDIRKTYDRLTEDTDLIKLSAEFAGSGFSGSGFSGSGFSGSGFSGSGFSGSGFSADTYSGSGFSGSGFSGSGFSGSGFSGSGFSGSGFSGSGFSGSGFSGSGFSGSGFSGSGFSGSGFSGSGFSAEDFSAAQYYSLIGWSNNVGTANEQVGANTWTTTGDFYIRVNGKNGISSTASPFQIDLMVNSDVCNNVGPMGSAPGSIANTSDTLILTDTSRFSGDTTALTSKLGDLADATNGTIVDFADAGNGRVHGLEDQADQNPACVYAENLVASAMKDVVDAYRAGNPNPDNSSGTNFKYIVLVGGDNVIPNFRYADTSSLAPEANFYPPVKATSTSEASLRANYVLGQDGYGSSKTITIGPVDFPVPGIPVGRLVENQTDIITMIDAYLASGQGRSDGLHAVSPQTSLVTGYDFVADTADAVASNLDAGTGTTGTKLVQEYGFAPTDNATTCDGNVGCPAWSADQLKAELATPRDITFLAGHFSANSALAADYQSVVTTSDFKSLTDGKAVNDIIFSIGCHSGYNTVDGDAITGVTDPLDWPQVFAQQGITSILGTGYQYGDTDFLEYSERIYAEFSRQLLSGTVGTPVAIGKALVASKIAYLQQTNDIGDLHLKSLLEAGLYGLPMLGVDFKYGRLGNPSAGSPSVTLTSAATGLRYVDLHEDTPPGDPQHKDLLNGDTADPGDTLTATWYEGNAGVHTEPGAPALPLYTTDVTPDTAGYILRGVGFREGTFADLSNIVPLSGAPATELQTTHTSFNSPVFYPNTMWSPNYWGLLTGGTQTSLLTTPAQHKATQPGSPFVQLRLYDSLDLRLFYINSNAVGIKALAPVINGVTSDLGTGDVSARVIGDSADGAGIYSVWVTYTTPNSGTWASFDLTQDTADTAIWKGNHSLPAGTQYMVQAVNTAGTITLNDNFGAYYLWGVSDADLEPTVLTLTGPASATYGNTTTITATLESNGNPIDGQIILTLGSATRSGTTTDGTVDIDLPVSSAAGTYTLAGAYLGDPAAGYQSSGASRPFVINKAASKVTVSCPTSVDYTGSAQEPCTARVTGVAANPLDELDQPVLVTYADNIDRGTATASAEFYGDAAHTGDTGSTSFSISVDQTITFGALADKTYGDADFTVSASASSGLALKFAASGSCTVSETGGLVHLTGAGSCTITASQAGDSTYNAASDVSQSFTIAQKPLTVTADNKSITYGSSDPPFTFTYGAFVNGETQAVIDTAPTCAVTVPHSNAGTYPITCSGGVDDNYSFSYVAGTLTVGKVFLRAEYIGDWFVESGAAPTFRVSVAPAVGPDGGSAATNVDFTKITAVFKVYPAGCSATCSTTPIGQPISATLSSAGLASVSGPSTLADDAYIVTVEVSGGPNVSSERAVAAFAIHPNTSTYVVGGGNLNKRRDGNANDNKGYFGFNVKKAKNSAIGSFTYIYRVRLESPEGPAPTPCLILSPTCRDVDVIVRSTSLTSASTTQSSTWPVTGTGAGKATIQFVDAIDLTPYANLMPLGTITFRYDALDAAVGPANDKFGLTVYTTSRGSTQQYHVAAGDAAGQTGTSVPTIMALIAPYDDPTSNADISAPPGNR